MGMSWPCSERYKHCYWRTTYHTPCVDDADEKGCACKLTNAGPDCKRGKYIVHGKKPLCVLPSFL